MCNNGSIGRVSSGHTPPHRLPDSSTKVTDTGDHQQGAQDLTEREWGRREGERRRCIVKGTRIGITSIQVLQNTTIPLIVGTCWKGIFHSYTIVSTVSAQHTSLEMLSQVKPMRKRRLSLQMNLISTRKASTRLSE